MATAGTTQESARPLPSVRRVLPGSLRGRPGEVPQGGHLLTGARDHRHGRLRRLLGGGDEPRRVGRCIDALPGAAPSPLLRRRGVRRPRGERRVLAERLPELRPGDVGLCGGHGRRHPFGLLMAVSPAAKAIGFPPFELPRPSRRSPGAGGDHLLAHPELSITFVRFLEPSPRSSSTLSVAPSISTAASCWRPARWGRASGRSSARSSSPATLPSIATGAVVGMGITAGGGGGGDDLRRRPGGSTGAGGGLGFLIWNWHRAARSLM